MDLNTLSHPSNLDDYFVNRPNKYKNQSNKEDLDGKFDSRLRHGGNG